MNKILLIKYGELSTKGGNRKFFIKVLANNIHKALVNHEYRLQITYNHIILNYQSDDVINILTKVFGIHNLIKVKQLAPDYELLKQAVLSLLNTKDIKTFKVETKRSNKNYQLNSLEISRDLGAFILRNTNLKVNVHQPDFLLKIEIRSEAFFVYEEIIPGAGGYPLGIQGKGVLMLSGGIDSPVAAYLAMKRGIKLLPVYFDSPPHTSPQALAKVEKLVEILQAYDPDLHLKVIYFTKIQETIYQKCKPEYLITLMRRMMYRIVNRYALDKKAQVIITGESIGQVASQTLESIAVINQVATIPVIRPLACYDKLEIIALAKKINTYETSILPFIDCCTIFVPKNPVIKPDLKTCEFEEQKFNMEQLFNETIE